MENSNSDTTLNNKFSLVFSGGRSEGMIGMRSGTCNRCGFEVYHFGGQIDLTKDYVYICT